MEKSSWKVTILSLVLPWPRLCFSWSNIGSISAPASICWSRLAASSGSMFLYHPHYHYHHHYHHHHHIHYYHHSIIELHKVKYSGFLLIFLLSKIRNKRSLRKERTRIK